MVKKQDQSIFYGMRVSRVSDGKEVSVIKLETTNEKDAIKRAKKIAGARDLTPDKFRIEIDREIRIHLRKTKEVI